MARRDAKGVRVITCSGHDFSKRFPSWRRWRRSTSTSSATAMSSISKPASPEWDAKGLHYETLAICRSLALARAVLAAAIAEKPAGRVMIRSRTRALKRYPEGDW